MQTNPEWAYLIDQYLNDRLSRAELRRLLQIAAERGDEEGLTQALRAQWDAGRQEPDHSGIDWQAKVKEILAGAQQADPVVMPHRSPVRRFRAIAAAACLAMLLGLGGYRIWLQHKTSVAAIGSAPLTAEISPGHTGAILTLSDGRQIVLDSAANGNLASQGGSEVIKENGQLHYQHLTAATETVYNTMTTPRGRQYALVLPDGTRVWLNAASSLQYPTAFRGTDRTVTLNGEGYFEVAPDAGKPFRVQVNGMKVEVLGTSFNIQSYEEEAGVTTSLLSGSVRLSSGSHEQLLRPGQQAIVRRGTDTAIEVHPADMNGVLAWKNGYFQFGHTSMAMIMRQLERWYNIQVHYQGKIPEREFYGEMERSLPLSSILHFLEKNHIHFTLNGNQLTVYE